MPSKERIGYLLEAYISHKATALEEQELMEWLQDAQEDGELKSYVKDVWDQNKPGTDISHINWDGMFDKVVKQGKVVALPQQSKARRMGWLKWTAAAVLIIGGTLTYRFLTPSNTNHRTAKVEENPVSGDIAPPAHNKATLSIANGKTIILENTEDGSLALQGVDNASKLNDELIYQAGVAPAVEYHTLNIPKGSKPMQLQLADGSKVWLNAASSITFPNIFSGMERKVTITGEAYFEVAKNAGKKFFVDANGTTTEVLGTHFNINAYKNESSVRVTLLEGSVNVNGSIIKPGQQARLTPDGMVRVTNGINIEQVMAWKNGLFEFNETDIQTIMRQMERWYDVEIVFEGNITQHFNGTIARQVNVSNVLNMLEKTGGVRFSIEGKKVIVKRY